MRTALRLVKKHRLITASREGQQVSCMTLWNMDREILEIESHPDGGFERFTRGSVTMTDEMVALGAGALDGQAKRVIRRSVTGPHEPVRGIARIEWKSDEDREKCIEYQKKRRGHAGTRWDDVEDLARLMRSGQWDSSRPGPIFIHPRLASSTTRLLKPVNGARRIMAHLEVEHDEFDVIILRPVAGVDTNP